MANYIDIFVQPISKKKIATYKKMTKLIGKVLLDHGAISSSDFVADDENATKLSFPKKIKLKTGEVLIFAMAEFKSKSHREKVFKAMMKDPRMQKMNPDKDLMNHKRAVMGGFKQLVSLK